MHSIARILILLLILIYSCKEKTSDESPIESNVTRDTTATPVKTAPVREGIFEYRIEANGIVKANIEITVYADAGGRVIKANAANGYYIKAGDIIAEYDKKEWELKLERAELKKYNAQKEYESQLLSYEKLVQDPNGTEATEIKKKLAVASGLAEATHEIKEIEYTISKAVTKAPISGRMADVKITTGQTARSGEELLKIYSLDQCLECKILESDLPQITIGQQAEIKLTGYSASILGKITSLNPIIDANGMILIRIAIPAIRNLFPGMHGSAVIKVPAKKSILVPKEAVVIRGNRSVVFTYENGLAKWNYVTVGRNNGVEIEIMEGLEKNGKVITSNNLQLAHEAVVKEENN
jgi:RND family efflux transporter MFP subunit